MSVGLAERTMAKPRLRAADDQPKRNDVSVKMDEKVAADCRIAASFKGVSLAEYLSEALRPIADRDINEGVAARAKAQQQEKKK